MPSVTSAAGPIDLGMDTSKNTIVAGILMPGQEIPVLDRIWNEEGSVRHLIGRFGDPGALRACYEAGPCGFELHRLLASMGVACEVVAPSLIPRRPGDRVKTDKRDASRLARLLRAGELTPIRVPAQAEEAVRDLVLARAALLADRKRGQQRITAMLMRHGRIWRAGYWTQAHEQWIAGQRFDEPALAAALAHYRAAWTPAGRSWTRSRRRWRRGRAGSHWGRWSPGWAATGASPSCTGSPWRRRWWTGGGSLGADVHGLHRARAIGVLQRRAHPPRLHHQGRVRARPHGADRGRVGLPVPTSDRRYPAPPPSAKGQDRCTEVGVSPRGACRGEMERRSGLTHEPAVDDPGG